MPRGGGSSHSSGSHGGFSSHSHTSSHSSSSHGSSHSSSYSRPSGSNYSRPSSSGSHTSYSRPSSGPSVSGPRPGSRPSGAGPRPVYTTPPVTPRRRYSGMGGLGFFGCGTFGFVLFAIIMICLLITFGLIRDSGSSGGNAITQSTTEREKLSPAECIESEYWYQDDWGDWITGSSASAINSMIDSMEKFYKATGVQPFVWVIGEQGASIRTDDQLEEAMVEKYDELYTDRGHMILAIREYPNASGNYNSAVYAGTSAQTVMDAEAREIVLDYLDYYYDNDSLSETQMFAKTFDSSASRIMSTAKTTKQIGRIAVIVVAIVVFVIFFIWSRLRKKKLQVESQKEENAQAQFNAQLEKEYIGVKCPNCGADVRFRKGTTGKCEYCQSYVVVDADGKVKLMSSND